MAAESDVIDRIDREIIAILRQDGRIPWQALASRVHLSANATAERARRLSRRGVIRRFTAEIDHKALGRDLEAVIDVIVNDDPLGFGEHLRGRRRSPGWPTSPAASISG